jgi:DNA-binding winged helix-turn-helix (wHTH) protein
MFDEFSLDTDRRELRGPRGLVPLEPQVFDLLAYLIRHRDRVVSKDDLMAAVWAGRIVSESALTTRINAARSAIGDSGEAQRLIKTLPRKGMRFVGSVREAEDSAAQPQSTPPLPDRPSVASMLSPSDSCAGLWPRPEGSPEVCLGSFAPCRSPSAIMGMSAMPR